MNECIFPRGLYGIRRSLCWEQSHHHGASAAPPASLRPSPPVPPIQLLVPQKVCGYIKASENSSQAAQSPKKGYLEGAERVLDQSTAEWWRSRQHRGYWGQGEGRGSRICKQQGMGWPGRKQEPQQGGRRVRRSEKQARPLPMMIEPRVSGQWARGDSARQLFLGKQNCFNSFLHYLQYFAPGRFEE